jgi:hypothetical protein
MTIQKGTERRACPGLIPKSVEHAARCRACGKCRALAKLLDAGKVEGAAPAGFSRAVSLATG